MLQDDLDLCERGFQVANARSLMQPGAGFDATKGAVVLGVNRLFEEGTFAAFCALLEKAYPKDHPVFGLKCGDGYREETRVVMTAGGFRSKERELDPALSLFIPQVKARVKAK